jgi:esterase
MSTLASYRVGTGPRVTILLHGFLGSGKNLKTLAQRWSQRAPSRSFLIPDLPGHGASPPPEINLGAPAGGEINLGALAVPVLDTAVAEGGAGPFEVVGHSLGGRVGLAALRDSPDLVTGVVLLDISPGPMDAIRSESRRVVEVLVSAPAEAADRRDLRRYLTEVGGLTAAVADWLLMNVRQEGGRYRWTFDRARLAALHDRISGEDLWAVVEGAHARVRCARGGRSRYVPPEDARRMESIGCEVHTIASAGHYLHVDALDELVDWLSRADGPGTPTG